MKTALTILMLPLATLALRAPERAMRHFPAEHSSAVRQFAMPVTRKAATTALVCSTLALLTANSAAPSAMADSVNIPTLPSATGQSPSQKTSDSSRGDAGAPPVPALSKAGGSLSIVNSEEADALRKMAEAMPEPIAPPGSDLERLFSGEESSSSTGSPLAHGR